MATIIIKWGDPHSGHLEMSDGGHTDANRSESITWTLGQKCGVKLISNIDVKAPSPINIIWERKPHRIGTSDKWEAKIHKDSRDHSEYNYFISWMPAGADPDPAHPIKIFDPKIAVKPDNKSFLQLLIIAITSALAAIFSIILFNKRRNIK